MKISRQIEGIYKDGQISLSEVPLEISGEIPVIVVFLADESPNHRAALTRLRLASFIEDWDNPEMDIYDNYDGAKHDIQSG
jgi:hypothetical protein